jgi:ribosomal-protein-serine acetyltransferase
MFELTVDQHICLRTLHPDNTKELFNLMERNRSRLRPWIHPSALPETLEDARRFVIECFFNSLDDPTDIMSIYADYFQELNGYFRDETPPNELGIWVDEKLAGAIPMFHPKDSSATVEFGYWITEEREGKGIVTRCVSALMDYATANMDAQRFVIGCAANNQRSRSIPERLGYRLHVMQPGKEVIGDFVYDRAIYGMRASAWRERNTKAKQRSGGK